MSRSTAILLISLLIAGEGCASGYGGVWERRVPGTHRSVACAREVASRLGYGVRGMGGSSFSAEKWFSEGTEQSIGYINGYLTGDSLTIRAERRRAGGGGRFPVPQPPRRPSALTGDTLTRPGPRAAALPPGQVASDARNIISRCRTA
jgi:hypothetical protein